MALCVGAIVYLGILYDAYDEKSEARMGKNSPDIEGIIMLSAVAVFLLAGFVWNKWHPAWVVFPIGGILCAIAGEIKRRNKKRGSGENHRIPVSIFREILPPCRRP